MSGCRIISENPIVCIDPDTKEKLEVRKIVDLESGHDVTVVFMKDDSLEVLQIHKDSLNTHAWKQALKFPDTNDLRYFTKVCNATEKARIQSITTVVSLAEIT